MTTEKFRGKFRIDSARMKNYDYSQNGAYFLTIVTNQPTRSFFLRNCGRHHAIVGYWKNCPKILVRKPQPLTNQKMAKISPQRGSLATVVRSYKSAVTRKSREIFPDFAWQSRFHDRIVRNDDELNRIREYIIANPTMWERDRNNF